ncbi:MAG: hypothetical protein RIE56_07840 [Amphiplicatus sp.]
MSAPMKWLVFSVMIVIALAAILVVWTGEVTQELIKAIASFAILAAAAFALNTVGRKGGAE